MPSRNIVVRSLVNSLDGMSNNVVDVGLRWIITFGTVEISKNGKDFHRKTAERESFILFLLPASLENLTIISELVTYPESFHA